MKSLPASPGSPRSEAPEIHRYPLRPEGFEEPLFQTRASKVEIMEHFLESDWLWRASDLSVGKDSLSRCPERLPGVPVRVVNRPGGVEVRRIGRGPHKKRFSRKNNRVVEVIERSREVARWWNEGSSVDRYVFKVLLSGGIMVDLALEGSGE